MVYTFILNCELYPLLQVCSYFRLAMLMQQQIFLIHLEDWLSKTTNSLSTNSLDGMSCTSSHLHNQSSCWRTCPRSLRFPTISKFRPKKKFPFPVLISVLRLPLPTSEVLARFSAASVASRLEYFDSDLERVLTVWNATLLDLEFWNPRPFQGLKKPNCLH